MELETRDRETSTVAFNELKSLGDANAIARVKESMSAIEGVSDWLDGEADVETDAATEAKNEVAEVEVANDELDETDIDFALDEDLDLDFEFDEVDAAQESLGADTVDADTLDVGDVGDVGDVDDFDIELDKPQQPVKVSEADSAQDLDDGVEQASSDESVRSAEADTLASLDVDLADLDFDFEPNSISESEPISAIESENEELDFLTSESDVSDGISLNSPALDDKITSDDDEEFDFSEFDEPEEIDASSANGSEPDSLPPSVSADTDTALDFASTDEDLDIELSAFDELSSSDDAILSSASDFSFDDADIDLG
jgi:pilus assembly protein FimV